MGSEIKEASARCPELCQVTKTQGQRMWLELLLKKNVIDVRTTQLTIC